MELVACVIGLALLQYNWFAVKCGQARGRYDVAAPGMSGHPEFERHFRVQANTLEQLIVFLPGMLMFGAYVNPSVSAATGLIFILGRALYARAYVRDPAGRGPGFLLTLLANAILVIGGVVGAVLHYTRG